MDIKGSAIGALLNSKECRSSEQRAVSSEQTSLDRVDKKGDPIDGEMPTPLSTEEWAFHRPYSVES